MTQELAIGRGMDASHASAAELWVDDEVRRGRNGLGGDLLRGHLMSARDRDRFDDVHRLGGGLLTLPILAHRALLPARERRCRHAGPRLPKPHSAHGTNTYS